MQRGGGNNPELTGKATFENAKGLFEKALKQFKKKQAKLREKNNKKAKEDAQEIAQDKQNNIPNKALIQLAQELWDNNDPQSINKDHTILRLFFEAYEHKDCTNEFKEKYLALATILAQFQQDDCNILSNQLNQIESEVDTLMNEFDDLYKQQQYTTKGAMELYEKLKKIFDDPNDPFNSYCGFVMIIILEKDPNVKMKYEKDPYNYTLEMKIVNKVLHEYKPYNQYGYGKHSTQIHVTDLIKMLGLRATLIWSIKNHNLDPQDIKQCIDDLLRANELDNSNSDKNISMGLKTMIPRAEHETKQEASKFKNIYH